MIRTVRIVATVALGFWSTVATAQSVPPPGGASDGRPGSGPSSGEPAASSAAAPERAPPSPVERAALVAQAQLLVDRAGRAFSAKDYETALGALRNAEPLAEAAEDQSLPLIRFNIARCLEELGQLKQALAAYQRYNELPDESHRKQRAWEAMKALRERVYATLSIVCSPPGSLIEISGVTQGAVSCPWQSDQVLPGAYAVKISHPGYESKIETIDVSAGQPYTVQVTLKSLAPPPTAVEFVQTPPPNLWPWMTMGAGLAISASGGFFTLSAIDNRRDAERLPPGAERDALQDDFEFNRTFSYVMYGTGTALIIGGFIWWLLDEPELASDGVGIRPGPMGLEVQF